MRRRDEERRKKDERDRGEQPVEAYFTRNCQPAGSAGRGATSGSPPRCSICVSAGMRSNSRGTIAVGMPRSSERRTIRSRTSSGAVENVIDDLLDLEARDRLVEIPARPGHRNAELAERCR